MNKNENYKSNKKYQYESTVEPQFNGLLWGGPSRDRGLKAPSAVQNTVNKCKNMNLK